MIIMAIITGISIIALIFILIKYNSINQHLSELKTRVEIYEREAIKYENKISSYEKEINDLKDKLAESEANYSASVTEIKLLKEANKELQNISEKLKSEFENITTKILEQSTKKLSEQNKEILSNAISPFKENLTHIKELEQKIQNYYDNENKERASLKTNIENLVKQSNEVKQTAEKLANALTTQVKYQGNWGEMILEKLLELSGLKKDREYIVQYKENDKQPDVMIILPNNRHLIIDSKVTLNALTDYYESQDEQAKKIIAQQILVSLKNHIDNLSKKEYEKILTDKSSTLDFVLMFIPIENVLQIVQYENIFNEAIKKRILIVTPTTLLATLKTIYYMWQQEKRRKDFEEILNAIGQLHNKLRTFTEHFTDIKKKLSDAYTAYENAEKTLISGKGNAISIIQNKIEPYINPKEKITKLQSSENNEE